MLIGLHFSEQVFLFFPQWKSWSDFFDIDGTRPEKVEPLFLSKVSFPFLVLIIQAGTTGNGPFQIRARVSLPKFYHSINLLHQEAPP